MEEITFVFSLGEVLVQRLVTMVCGPKLAHITCFCTAHKLKRFLHFLMVVGGGIKRRFCDTNWNSNVSKYLLEHSHVYSLRYYLWLLLCYSSIDQQLQQRLWPPSLKFTICPFTEKSLPTPVLEYGLQSRKWITSRLSANPLM